MKNKKPISAETHFEEWRKDTEYVREFETQKPEFEKAQCVIDQSNLKQSET